MTLPSQTYTANLLLQLMSAFDFELLRPHLSRIEMRVKQELYAVDRPIEFVHFLEGGVASVVSPQEGGDLIEIGLHGYEGMSGTPVVLGAGQTPNASMMQVDGTTSLRIPSEKLIAACEVSASLRLLLLRYAHTFSLQAAQTGASNAHFALTERLARWLLMCHDRVPGDELKLTHEFMSMMIGVRRSGVTVTLHTLESGGAVDTSRGRIIVRSRARLEEIAGDSYGIPEREYRRLIGPFGKSQVKSSVIPITAGTTRETTSRP